MCYQLLFQVKLNKFHIGDMLVQVCILVLCILDEILAS